MKLDDQPSLKIELGISTKVGASFADLYKRAHEHTRVVVAACAELKHLSDPEFVWRCPIIVIDDLYVLVIPIEPAPQVELAGFAGKRGKAARLREQDAAVQAAVDMTYAGVQAGAELLRKVAETVDTSPDAARELRHLEILTGVDTGPARRFLNRRRGAFLATIEEKSVLFEGEPVRPSQQVGESMRVLAKLVRPTSATAFERCEVLEVQGGQPLEGVSSGGRKEFRFANLEPWQRVALAGARESGQHIQLQAFNRIGTCSLEHGPADVVAVENWRELHGAAMAVLQQRPIAKDSDSSNDECADGDGPRAVDDAACG